MSTVATERAPLPERETPLSQVIAEQGRVKGWVADKAGIRADRLSRLISGERDMRVSEATRLAEVLGVPVTTLLPETNE